MRPHATAAIAALAAALALGGALLGIAGEGNGLPATGREPASASAAGDPTRGAAALGACLPCHSVEPGVHLTGPSLAAIWGRRAGTVPGFTRYSRPLREAQFEWNERTLDRWLEDPQALVPGNGMAFPGIKAPRERADLVAYLRARAAGTAPPPPSGGTMGTRPPLDLKALGAEHRVTAIRHCGDAYRVTTADGRTIVIWEFNLRFKTDSSKLGPNPGHPVMLPSGMYGDRATIVFANPSEITPAITRGC